MGLGEQLKKILNEKHMTIIELSQLTGISKNTLYAITKRDSHNIKYENLRKIATALGMTPEQFMECSFSKTLEESLKNENGHYFIDSQNNVNYISSEEVKALNSHYPGTQRFTEKNDTLAAHFDGDEFTPEELEEIKQFAEFVKSKRKDD